LEKFANLRSVPNWISYLQTNSWFFSPFQDILFNFLRSKTGLDFTILLFNLCFESGEVHMEKVVLLYTSFKNIFYFKIFDLEKALFGVNQV
jgi:hypothetical protein